MANLYRVIYSTVKGPQHAQAALVSATTVANAIAAVKTADGQYTDIISVTQQPTPPGGLLVGS